MDLFSSGSCSTHGLWKCE